MKNMNKLMTYVKKLILLVIFYVIIHGNQKDAMMILGIKINLMSVLNL